MSVNVTIKNQTVDYIFYYGAEHDLGIRPNKQVEIPLTDQRDNVILSFDRCENPTPWKKCGLGEGVLQFESNPASGQGQLVVEMDPAPAGPQETPAPTFEVSGDITGVGQDIWTKGIELNLQGYNVNQIILTITE